MHTSVGISKIFKNVFERGLFCSPRLQLFDEKKIENSNIVKYYYSLKTIIFYLNIF